MTRVISAAGRPSLPRVFNVIFQVGRALAFSVDVALGDDWLETIGRRASDLLQAERVAIVTVPTVARRYAPLLTKGLSAAGAKVERLGAD